MRFRGVIVLCAVLSGCTQSNSVVCGNLICSEAAVCSPTGDACVLPAQLDACQGKVDDDGCGYPGANTAVCVSGVCTEIGCGNNHVDPQLGEICDDGNRLSGDGCSSDCRSSERCGDGSTDFALGEQCDDGISNSDEPGAACRPNCRLARCGDGIVDPGEQCDDGNTVPGDGCRADCLGRWTPMASNTLAYFIDVWAVDAAHAWAISDSDRVMRWDGSTWTRLPSTGALGFKHVWASSDQDLWVIPITGTVVWHYTGTNWAPVDLAFTVLAVHGQGPDDIWFAGLPGTNTPALGHWYGGAIHMIPMTGGTPPATHLEQVLALPNGIVYVMDYDRNVFKYTSGAATPWELVTTYGALVVGTSATDVTVFTNLPFGAKHFDGVSWTPLAGADELSSFYDASASASSTAKETLVLGNGLLVCDETNCTISPLPTTHYINAVSTYAPNHAFIVGEYGTILY